MPRGVPLDGTCRARSSQTGERCKLAPASTFHVADNDGDDRLCRFRFHGGLSPAVVARATKRAERYALYGPPEFWVPMYVRNLRLRRWVHFQMKMQVRELRKRGQDIAEYNRLTNSHLPVPKKREKPTRTPYNAPTSTAYTPPNAPGEVGEPIDFDDGDAASYWGL